MLDQRPGRRSRRLREARDVASKVRQELSSTCKPLDSGSGKPAISDEMRSADRRDLRDNVRTLTAIGAMNSWGRKAARKLNSPSVPGGRGCIREAPHVRVIFRPLNLSRKCEGAQGGGDGSGAPTPGADTSASTFPRSLSRASPRIAPDPRSPSSSWWRRTSGSGQGGS
jgi:hypothetical protein